MTWYRYDAQRKSLRLSLHVQPGARRSGLAGLHGERLKVRIAAPAVDDKANRLLIAFLAERFQLVPGKVMISHGERSRAKTVDITDIEPDVVERISRLAVNED